MTVISHAGQAAGGHHTREQEHADHPKSSLYVQFLPYFNEMNIASLVQYGLSWLQHVMVPFARPVADKQLVRDTRLIGRVTSSHPELIVLTISG